MDLLTSIDKVINLTTCTIAMQGVVSGVVYLTHRRNCPANLHRPEFSVSDNGTTITASGWLMEPDSGRCPSAQHLDMICLAAMMIANVVGNVYIFAGPLYHRYKDLQRIDDHLKKYVPAEFRTVLTSDQKIVRKIHSKQQSQQIRDTSEISNPIQQEEVEQELERNLDLEDADSTEEQNLRGSRLGQDDVAYASEQAAVHERCIKALDVLIEEEECQNDELLPTQSRYTEFIPWDKIETYRQYLRRRLYGSRVDNGILSEIRWAKFNSRRIDMTGGTSQEKRALRADVLKGMKDRRQTLNNELQKYRKVANNALRESRFGSAV